MLYIAPIVQILWTLSHKTRVDKVLLCLDDGQIVGVYSHSVEVFTYLIDRPVFRTGHLCLRKSDPFIMLSGGIREWLYGASELKTQKWVYKHGCQAMHLETFTAEITTQHSRITTYKFVAISVLSI